MGGSFICVQKSEQSGFWPNLVNAEGGDCVVVPVDNLDRLMHSGNLQVEVGRGLESAELGLTESTLIVAEIKSILVNRSHVRKRFCTGVVLWSGTYVHQAMSA